MSDIPPRRVPTSSGLGGDPPGSKSKPKAGPQPTPDENIFKHGGNYPWNRANPVPVIPDLWRSKPTADDNPFKVEPSPAKPAPDLIRPEQSLADASPGIPKLTMAQIVSRSIAGIPPDVVAGRATVSGRGSIRGAPAPVDNSCGGPIPTGGVSIGTPRPTQPDPGRGSIRGAPAPVDNSRGGPVPTGGVSIGTPRPTQPDPGRGSIRGAPAPVDNSCGGPIPTGGGPIGTPRPTQPARPHPGTVRFGPALANTTRTIPPPPLEERSFHESWASNLVSPTDPLPNPLHSGPTDLPANQLAIATQNVVSQVPPSIFVRGQCHHFLVDTKSTDIEALEVLVEIKREKYLTVIGPFFAELNTQGGFYIGFGEIFEARDAIQLFQKYNWDVISMSVTAFNDITRFAFPISQDLNDVVYARVYCGPQSAIDAESVERVVRPILSLVGQVSALMRLEVGQPDDPSVVRYYELAVVYSSTWNALNAIRALNGVRTPELVLEVMPDRENSHFATSTRARHEFEVQMRGSRRGSSRRGNKSGRRPPATPKAFDPQASPTRGEPDYVIHMGGIMYGTDSRTSVMCRNIPHKMTWRELKSILDLSSAGRYDYLYLRINFGDNHNVGYAFVNFATAADIVPFVTARHGRTWPGFEQFTEKIAEITYADVQGFGNLVERFRNSPVILNHPDNRPKLFHTSGPRVGMEACFPPVNNFYTLSQGVFRSQNDSGLRPNLTPRSFLGATPRTPAHQSAPADDDQAATGGFQPRTPGTGSASRSSWSRYGRR